MSLAHTYSIMQLGGSDDSELFFIFANYLLSITHPAREIKVPTSLDLVNHQELAIGFSGIPTTEEEKANIRKIPYGIIPPWQDSEVLH